MAYQRVLTACDRSAVAITERPANWMQVVHDETIRGQQILLELSAGLALHHADIEVVEMAHSMDSLYEYAMHQLMQANIEKAAEPLSAVQLVIGGLLDAWVHSI